MRVNYTLDKVPTLKLYNNKIITNPSGEPPCEVSYQYNDYGYRSVDKYKELLNNEYNIVCIGSSFTFGIGVEYDEIWPTKLSNLLHKSVINLAWPGASHGYVIWQLLNVLNNVQKENIFVEIPPKGRTFELTDKYFENENNLEGDYQNRTEFILNEADNDDLLLKSLCKANNVNYIECYEFGEPQHQKWLPLAKDNGHFGPKWHEFIANYFYKKIEK
jgi:hypothetical protein